MTVKYISSYISYKDCEVWLPFLKETGGTDLVEASGGTEGDAPLEEKVGSIVRTVKDLHVPRFMKDPYEKTLQLLKTQYSEGEVPETPKGTEWSCVFYLGKLGDTYQGEKDKVGEKEISPEYGDVIFFNSEEKYESGFITEGVSGRLYAFWSEVPK